MLPADLVSKFTIATMGERQLLYIPTTQILTYLAPVAEVTSAIASDGFGSFRPLPEYMEKMLKDESVLIMTDNQFPIGFLGFSRHDHEGEVVMGESRAVRKQFQGQGVGSELLRAAIRLTEPTAVMAQTQNPHELYSSYRVLHSMGSECVYPIDRLYSDDARASALLSHKLQIWEIAPETVDMRTGARQKAFEDDTDGRLGDYEINHNHPGIAKMDQRMLELGLDRERGDAIIYLAFLC